jgi:hypothetical protein
MRKLIISSAVVVLGLLGTSAYLISTNGFEPVRRAPASLSNAGEPSRPRATVGLARALEKDIPNAKFRADGKNISPERIAAIEGRIDALLKLKGDPRVAERLKPTTELGKRLCRLAMSVRFGNDLPDDEMKQLGEAYLNGFAGAREETMNEARSALGNLSGAEFAQERLGVFAVLNGMPDSAAEVKSLALTELTAGAPPARPTAEEAAGNPDARAQAMSFGPAQVLPLYTYRMYLDSVGSNPDEAMSGTVQALQSQQDAGIRQMLATAYVSEYPEMKPQLYERLSQSQISVPDVLPQERSNTPRTSTAPQVLVTD